MAGEERTEREVHRYYGCPWCGPSGKWGVSFCGWVMVAIGFAWLLSNLEVIPADWWGILLPVLIIGWGIAILGAARKSRQ